MKRFLPLLLSLLLAGCYSDQKQQLSTCQLQAKERNQSNANGDSDMAENIELCMRAHGYEIVTNDCPASVRIDYENHIFPDSIPKPNPNVYNSLTKEQQDRLNIETGKKIEAIEAMQKIEPACYEPMGWFGKRSLRLKKWLGTSN
jgi:hypothetical protein